MKNRRRFISQLGLLVAGVAIFPSIGYTEWKRRKKFGIQLYSLRSKLTKGAVEPVISEIAKAGYSYVEGFGYSSQNGFWGLSPKEFKVLLDKYNLTCPSVHYDFYSYQKSGDIEIIKNYVEVAKTLGSKYITIPGISSEVYKDEEKTKAWLIQLNAAAKITKDAGLKLAYHNHYVEFYALPSGRNAYEILLEGTDPDLVDFEMDIYWIVKSNQDPIALIKKYPGRFKMWHIKDMKKSNPAKNAEIGKGSIDFLPIFKEAKLSGMKYAFMEQENFDIDPYESINISAKYIKENL